MGSIWVAAGDGGGVIRGDAVELSLDEAAHPSHMVAPRVR